MPQILGALRLAAQLQLSGARDNDKGKWPRETHCYHIRRNEFAEPDARIEPSCRQIHQFSARDNLQLDLWIAAAKGGDRRLKQQRNHASRHG